jgi:hypothetical protein
MLKKMTKLHIKPLLFLAIPILALLLIVALCAPLYLNYADPPFKADAVVVFAGETNMGARRQEANRLLAAGYANCLIIPGFGYIMGSADRLLPAVIDGKFAHRKGSDLRGKYPDFYENTHIEALEAKRIMDCFHLKKANFVSSPYHMRRIKMITEHVFHKNNPGGDAYQIHFVPAPLEPSMAKAAPWIKKYIKHVALEYVKMAWFFSYQLFSQANG